MLSLKRHNLNLLTMNPFLLTMLSDVALQQNPFLYLLFRFPYS